ncbi:MAG: hypothetical protein ACJ74H_00695 [Thermoanaerobaculia bacterium]
MLKAIGDGFCNLDGLFYHAGEETHMTETTDDSTEALTDAEVPMTVMTPSTVTRTYYDILAAEIMEDLDKVAAKMPKLEARHRVSANAMRAHVNVPRAFLGTAIVTAEETPKIESAAKLVPAEGRDTLQFLDAFRVVDDKLAALRAELRLTMMSRKTTLALESLQVYALARGLARDERVTGVAAHVENLRRDLGKRGRPRKK